jgi:predicted PolB exonuclease-like 3'-5' exonuclease
MGSEKTVAFDIETIANYALIETLPAPEVKLGNTKDEEKIKAKLQEADQKRRESMGLNKFENLVCLFAWYDGEKSGYVLLKEANQQSERNLLLKVWEILNRYDHFVTFNGNEFDIPVLNLHSLFASVRPPINISARKYVISNHTDLRAVLGNWDSYAPGKLDPYLRMCLGRSKPENIDGSMVQHYWDCDMQDQIVEYGMGDVKDTWDLYQHVKEYYPGI